jgi:hypothetical protein
MTLSTERKAPYHSARIRVSIWLIPFAVLMAVIPVA